MPSSTIEKASRDKACCKRLAKNPGRSFFTVTGTMPHAVIKRERLSPTIGEVFAPYTTSTQGTKWAGIKKCKPIMRAAVFRPLAISLIGKLVLLLANTASGFAYFSNLVNSSRLISKRSGTHSITKSISDQSTSSSEPATDSK